MTWLVVALVVLLLSLSLYWLLVLTEGVYLGRRMVIWLYDLTAHKYDDIKQFNPADERYSVARPLLRALDDKPEPLILDVATGTGRVPVVLIAEPGFDGRIIGLDAARRMLSLASEKLVPPATGNCGIIAELVQQRAVPLPFADNTFDAVTCLEALEFFPSDVEALQEMVRVLRPDGFLMTSRRRGWEGKLFLGRYRPAADFEALLRRLGLVEVQTRLWEVNYDMVTARKRCKSRSK